LRKYLGILQLPAESQERLEIVVHSLRSSLDIYEKLGPTTDSFIDMMRHRKEEVMGPNK